MKKLNNDTKASHRTSTMLENLNSRLVNYILDETFCPVAKMRLFSDGININTRLYKPELAIGDTACLTCGNCVDACPVVREENGFIFVQNLRTSMALENIVGDKCRRCYKCIGACPQVKKTLKEYASAFRRGEKIVHLFFAGVVALLAMTGIALTHFTGYLPSLEINLLRWTHRILGVLLIFIPIVYLVLDRNHLIRVFRNIFKWGKGDWNWLLALFRHIWRSKKFAMPDKVQFNPGQKAWYLYTLFTVLTIMGISGIIQWIGLDYRWVDQSTLTLFMNLHMAFALMTDCLLLVHIYLKYMRNWIILFSDIVRSLMTEGHLIYSEHYQKKLPDIDLTK